MYYLLYTVFYFISLLPFSILYGLSNLVSFILEKIIGYRKEIIYANIGNAFPEKTPKEIKAIAHQFYTNLTDSMVETIKLLSISAGSLNKRAVMDVKAVNEAIEKGIPVQFFAAHIFGWEYGNAIAAKKLSKTFLGIYMRINNKAVEKIFLKLRSRTGAKLVSTADMPWFVQQNEMKEFVPGFIADQNPPNEKSAYWLYFFGKPVPFLTGPEKFGQRYHSSAWFVSTHKIKRGYYKFEILPICPDVADLASGELTRRYRDILEKEIQRDPACYLWSHKRWKWQWESRFQRRWIDENQLSN